jgi:hypothetical protein
MSYPDEWERILRDHLAGRNDEPELLWGAWVSKSISTDTMTQVVGGVWSAAEYPEWLLRRRTWITMFTAAGYTVDGQPGERPTEPVTLYRGAPARLARRMSWTSDREQAEWFANREAKFGGSPGNVYTITAPPLSLLCFNGGISGRGESEYVINPEGLPRVRRPANA